RISALDRGFLFGDAVYEVLRVYRGRPWLADEHFARLRRSLEEVRLGGVDLGRLRRRMAETVAAGHFREAAGYLQNTPGAAPRSHAFPPDAVPLELLFVQEFKDSYAEARRQGAAVITRPDIRWGRCDIKSTNLLGNVLALQAAKEAGCLEALFYLPDGRRNRWMFRRAYTKASSGDQGHFRREGQPTSTTGIPVSPSTYFVAATASGQ